MSEQSKAPRRFDVKRLQVGERLSRVQYYQVVAVDEAGGVVTLENTQGLRSKVSFEVAAAELHAASLYGREEQVSRTDLVERLTHAGDTVFTVRFRKQLTEKGVSEKLASLTPEELADDRTRRAIARDLLEGEERVLVGYLLPGQERLGRSMVIDLEVEGGEHAVRMVDHRTVTELICKNVRWWCEG